MELLEKEKLEKGPACRQAGQTLLIVVLVMVISLTVGLSIASKTITNLRTTTEEADSAKALSAAETGVQQSIKTGLLAQGSFTSNNTAFSSSVTPVSGTSFLVNAGNVISQDEGTDVWLISHDASGNLVLPFSSWAPAGGTLTIYWGDSPGNCSIPSQAPAALEIVKITGTLASNAVSARYGYDPCTRSNNFTSVAQSVNTVSGKTFYYNTTISPISVSSGLLVRIVPLYANTIIAVAKAALDPALPTQGSIITSTGTSGNVVRKISVVANYYSLPSQFFTYGLFVPK